MSPVGEANCFSKKNTEFLINSGHKIVAVIVSDFGRGGFCCSRGGVRRYDAETGGCME